MKKIFNQVKEFWKQDLKISYLISIFIFLAILITINYNLDFEASVMRPQKRTFIYPFITFLYYGFPYFSAFVLYAHFYKRWDIFRKKMFWIPAITAIAILTFNEAFYSHLLWVETNIRPEIQFFTRKCTYEFFSAFLYFLPIAAYWKIMDSKKMPLYGFGLGKFDVKPYLLMLACMLPLLIVASFGADFQSSYPVYKDKGFSVAMGIPEWVSASFFEFCYGFDFVMVEFIFRGFMVMALIEVVGIHAVIPMASVYCVFHFGKPIGETISSFFGGALLGIVAYHSRSIYGGVLVHWGIAFLMELLAFLQKT
jgi:hypothetical protein